MSVFQTIKLIPSPLRKQGVWIIVSAVLQAILNMAGLTVLIPLIILIFDPDKLVNYDWFNSYRDLIVIAIVCFIIIKNLLNIQLTNLRIRYINKLFCYYSEKMYDSYYHQGLLFTKEKHSDKLTYNTNTVSYLFTHGILSLTFSMISEILLLLFIWCGILWFSPIIALCIAICLLPFIIIYFYWVRKKLAVYGKEENEAKRRIMTLVGDTFRGYQEVKLNDAYPWLKKRFAANISLITNCREWITRALQIPQGMMEFYVIAGIILFAIAGGNNSETRLTLGILAVSALRMLPSLRSLITMATQWKNNAFTISIIKNIPEITEKTDELQSIDFQKQIKINNISFRYPGKDSYILKNFSLNINKGECIGIQGISGIGKTTLYNLLLGFYMPQEGEILIDNIQLNKQTCNAWQKLIAYVPQDIFIMDATLAENIAFGAENIDNERLMTAIGQSGLISRLSSLSDGIHTRIGQNGSFLSGGERQRVGIARALYKKAGVLLFDETTSSLDSKAEKEIMDTIYKLSTDNNNLTITIISHKQSALTFCNRIVDLDKDLL